MALSSVHKLGDIFQTDENHVLFTEHESFAMTVGVWLAYQDPLAIDSVPRPGSSYRRG